MSQEEKLQPENVFKKVDIHPRLNGLLNGGDASSQKSKPLSKRFVLELGKTTDERFPEFNYIDLIKEQGKISKNLKGNQDPLGDGFHDDDDTDKLQALAKKFEEKYGSSKKKGGSYVNEFVDIGYGYDESDSFLDNSEAYDEVVPSDWTTLHGGFYINQGDLDFRPLTPERMDESRADESIRSDEKIKKKKKSSSLVPKVKKDLGTQKSKNKLLNLGKQRKRQESLLKAHKILVKKKKKKLPAADGNTKKQKDKSFEDDVPLSKICKPDPKISKTKDSQDDDIPLAKISNKAENFISLKPILNIPQVVVSSATSTPVGTTQVSNESQKVNIKEEVALPENLSQDLLDDISKLKKLSIDSVKGKFFNGEVNTTLLSFTKNTRLLSPKVRNVVFDHIIYYLPCGKDTLTKRCRSLLVQYQKDLEDEPMKMLKKVITDSMPSQKQAYDEEVAKHLQEQAREQIKQTENDSTKGNEEENSAGGSEDKNKKPPPKKKYIWPDNVKKALMNVVKVRVGLYKMSKSKSMTPEEYIKDFLESEIRVIWPKGWMTSRMLYRESRFAHTEITQPSKAKKVVKKIEDTENPTLSSNNTIVSIKASGIVTSTNTKTTPTFIDLSKTNEPLPQTTKFKSPITTTTPTFLQAKVSNSIISNSSKVQVKSTSISSLSTKTNTVSSYTVSKNTTKVTSESKVAKKCIIVTTCQSLTLEKLKEGSFKFLTSSNKPIYLSTSVGVTKLSSNLKLVGSNKSLGEANAKFIASMVENKLAINNQKIITSEKPKASTPSIISKPKLQERQIVVDSQINKLKSGKQVIFSQTKVKTNDEKSLASCIASSQINVTNTISCLSTKISSFATTPIISKRNIDIEKLDARNIAKQIKRKSSFDDDHNRTIANKRSIMSPSIVQSTHEKSWMDVETDLARLSSEVKMSKILSSTKKSETLTELSLDDLVGLDKESSHSVIRKTGYSASLKIHERSISQTELSRKSISPVLSSHSERLEHRKPSLPSQHDRHPIFSSGGNTSSYPPQVSRISTSSSPESLTNRKVPMHPSLLMANQKRTATSSQMLSHNTMQKDIYTSNENIQRAQSLSSSSHSSPSIIKPNSNINHPSSRLSHHSSILQTSSQTLNASRDHSIQMSANYHHTSPVKIQHSNQKHSSMNLSKTSPNRIITSSTSFTKQPDFMHPTMRTANDHPHQSMRVHQENIHHSMRGMPLDANMHPINRSSLNHQIMGVSSLNHPHQTMRSHPEIMRSIDHTQQHIHSQLQHPVMHNHGIHSGMSASSRQLPPPKQRRLSAEEEILQIQHELMRSRNTSESNSNVERCLKFN